METNDKIISYARLNDYHTTFVKPIISPAKNAFQKTGDSISGKILLTSDKNRGDSVPELEGNQLFFLQKNILEYVYPVGSIYISATSVNPNKLFGFGSWQPIEGKFLIGADGDKYKAGEIGDGEILFSNTDTSAYPYLVVYMWKRIE